MDINHYEVAKRLIGPIHPVGAEHIDRQCIENIKAHISLVDDLTVEVIEVYRDNINRQESSMADAGKLAKEFMKRLEYLLEGSWVDERN